MGSDVVDQLQTQLRDSLRPAIEEARERDNPRLAEMMEAMRDVLLQQSGEAVRSRLEAYGIAVFTPDQAKALISVAGQEMARQVVAEARLKQLNWSNKVWSNRAARYAVIGGVIALVLSSVGIALANLAIIFGKVR